MISAAQLTQLTQPLVERAGLRDRAARFVLERLGFYTIDAASPSYYHRGAFNPSDAHNSGALQSQRLQSGIWLDAKMQAFLIDHPTGQGIEINSGLSTRFHRLSDQADWPRFQWLSVNTAEVDDCLKFVFPSIDNYRSVASATPLWSWDKYANWRGTPASIVVVGEDSPLAQNHTVEALFASIARAKAHGFSHIDVLLNHSIHDLPTLLAEHGKGLFIRDGFTPSAPKSPLWARLNPFFKTPRACVPASTWVHLSR